MVAFAPQKLDLFRWIEFFITSFLFVILLIVNSFFSSAQSEAIESTRTPMPVIESGDRWRPRLHHPFAMNPGLPYHSFTPQTSKGLKNVDVISVRMVGFFCRFPEFFLSCTWCPFRSNWLIPYMILFVRIRIPRPNCITTIVIWYSTSSSYSRHPTPRHCDSYSFGFET